MAEPDFSIQPAAHEDAKDDARSAAKWLIAAFAAVGAVLVSGVGFSSIGELRDWDLAVAILACVVGISSVILAVTLVADVLTPEPLTLANLAESQGRRNAGTGRRTENNLIAYLEGDPSFLQGIDENAPRERCLIVAYKNYAAALSARYQASKALWEVTRNDDADSPAAQKANAEFRAANARASTMHYTVRRLERVAAAQQTVLRLRSRRGTLIVLAMLIALSIGAFAFVSGSSDSRDIPQKGSVLVEHGLGGEFDGRHALRPRPS